MRKLFSVGIKWLDNGTEYDVLIYEFDCHPNGYTDEDIFFYGMGETCIKAAIVSQEPCEGEWIITELYDVIDIPDEE